MVMIVSREFGRIHWAYSSSNFVWNNLLTFRSNFGLPGPFARKLVLQVIRRDWM